MRRITIISSAAAVLITLSTAAPSFAQSRTAAAAPRITVPTLTVLQDSGGTAPGYLFLTPKVQGGSPAGATVGPLITDDQGRPVWFVDLPDGIQASDLRVQKYLDQPVLTYMVGTPGADEPDRIAYIVNTDYHVVATVRAGNGLSLGQHEFELTNAGTALITSYRRTTTDASSVGGPVNQAITEAVVQEVNVGTGAVLFEWHSLDHIPLADSYQPLPASADTPWDYVHINSVRADTDHNLIVSLRHTWAVYKIGRRSGDILWQLGGKHSSFPVTDNFAFAWQHDAEPAGKNQYRIFDNDSDGTPIRPESRVLTVRVDPASDVASLVSSVTHPDQLSVPSQGNSQRLPNHDLLVDWGALGRVSEFDRHGRLLYDAVLDNNYSSYRGFKYAWSGQPTTHPALTATADGAHTALDIVWNGATQVARWALRGGDTRTDLHPYRTVSWNGLDTALTVEDPPPFLQAVALDGSGRAIRTSSVISTG